MRKTLLLAGAAAVLLAACGGSDLDIGVFSVEGTWAGTVRLPVPATEDPADSAQYVFVLELDQSERDVSGSGEVQTDAESLDIDVDGQWDYPDVGLLFTAPEFDAVVYQSRFGATRDTLKGTLTGSGFSGATLDLIRQVPALP